MVKRQANDPNYGHASSHDDGPKEKDDKSMNYGVSLADPVTQNQLEAGSVDDFGVRLAILMEAHGHKSGREFARFVDIGPTSVQNYLGGQLPGLDKVARIAARTGASVGWLVTGKPENQWDAELAVMIAKREVDTINAMSDVSPETRRTVNENLVRAEQQRIAGEKGALVDGDALLVDPALADFALLPRYNVQAAAGNGLVAHDEAEVERIAFRLDWLRDVGVDPDQAELLTAAGDSMSPTIPDGSLMLVDRRQGQPIKSGFVYVIVLAGEVIVKRLSRNVDGTIDLISDNPLYPVQTIDQSRLEQIYFAGRVFWIGKTL